MKAIQIRNLGRYSVQNAASSSAIEAVDLPIPEPKQGEMTIQLKATTVIRDNLTWPELYHDPPAGLGNDFAGIVTAAGDSESAFKVGDKVYGMRNAKGGGTWAEYCMISTQEAFPKPEALSWEQAAALPLSAMTAHQALFQHGKLPGQGDHSRKVLVTGASGGVGIFVVQLAAIAGYHVVVASSSLAKNEAFLTSLGASKCIEYKDPPTLSREMDVVIDTVGGNVLEECWKAVKHGGALVSVASSSYDFVEEHRRKGIAVDGVDANFFIVEPSLESMEHISKVVEENVAFRIPIAKTMPLDKAREAYDLVQAGEAGRGKVVLTIPA